MRLRSIVKRRRFIALELYANRTKAQGTQIRTLTRVFPAYDTIRLVAAAPSLRDLWLEQVNENPSALITRAGLSHLRSSIYHPRTGW